MPPAGAGNGNIAYVGVSGAGGGGTVATPIPIVANLAALEALPVTGYIVGQPAVVQSMMALWTLQAPSTATVDGITAVFASGGEQIWQRAATLNPPHVQRQSAWVIDPVAGNDESAGSSAAPLKTNLELEQRLTRTPYLNQATTLTYNSAPPTTDPYRLKPVMGPNGSLTITGQMVAAGTATINVVAPNTSGTGFYTLTFSGATVTPAAGMYVEDTTQSIFFFLDEQVSAGVWRITNPHTSPLGSQPDAVPAHGDTVAFFNQTIVPVADSIDCEGLGVGGIFLQQVGFSAQEVVITVGAFVTANDVSFPSALVESLPLPGSVPFFFGCWFGGFFGTGGFTGSALMYGGAVEGGAPFFAEGSVLDGDIIIAEDLDYLGDLEIGRAFLGATPDAAPNPQGHVLGIARTAPTAYVRGPAGLNVAQGAAWRVTGLTATAFFQNTGGLQIDGAANAFSFNTGTGAYNTPAVAVTPANIDTNGSLSNPKTGSRIYVS